MMFIYNKRFTKMDTAHSTLTAQIQMMIEGIRKISNVGPVNAPTLNMITLSLQKFEETIVRNPEFLADPSKELVGKFEDLNREFLSFARKISSMSTKIIVFAMHEIQRHFYESLGLKSSNLQSKIQDMSNSLQILRSSLEGRDSELSKFRSDQIRALKIFSMKSRKIVLIWRLWNLNLEEEGSEAGKEQLGKSRKLTSPR